MRRIHRAKTVAVCDCETDPFQHGAHIAPFVWGYFDGHEYRTFNRTQQFVDYVREKNIVLYAHNGGKFDFIFLLPYIEGETRAKIINGRHVSFNIGNCELRDSFSIIPEKLAKFGGKKSIEYWKLAKEHRKKYKAEILEYLEADCRSLYDVVSRFRTIVGTRKTIAGNALAFCKKEMNIDPGETNARFDARMRPYYFGGRTQCWQPGEHRNVKIIDIHSAYPYAMLYHHATGSDFIHTDTLDGLSERQINRAFITLECHSDGAFAERTPTDGLLFKNGFGEFNVTGWEYNAARHLGLLSRERIISVRYTKAAITFRPYVMHWYALKSRTDKRKDPITYTIAKILLNSLYGKLAEDPAKYKDYKIVPAGTPCDRENGWDVARENGNLEIHARDALWKWRDHTTGDLTDDGNAARIYKNVATGASITGFTRAHLLTIAHRIGMEHVIYCDTDSLHLTHDAPMDEVKLGPDLGEWEYEEPCAPVAYYAGKKEYAYERSAWDDPRDRYKVVCKGARDMTFDQMRRMTMNGETIQWANPAPTYSFDGSHRYIVRNIRATAFSNG